MRICLVAEATLLSDLLSSALTDAGHEVSRHEGGPPLTEKPCASDAVVVHVTDASSEGLGFVHVIRNKCDVPLLVVAPAADIDAVRDALELEVEAVLADDQPLSILVSSLLVISSGFSLLNRRRKEVSPLPTMQTMSLAQMSPGSEAHLTDREADILGKIRDGASNKEIANALAISDSTVKVHLRSIFNKTHSRNRTQAAIWAQAHLDA